MPDWLVAEAQPNSAAPRSRFSLPSFRRRAKSTPPAGKAIERGLPGAPADAAHGDEAERSRHDIGPGLITSKLTPFGPKPPEPPRRPSPLSRRAMRRTGSRAARFAWQQVPTPGKLRALGKGSVIKGLDLVANRNPIYRFFLKRLPFGAKTKVAISAACGCTSGCGCCSSCCSCSGCILPLLVLFVIIGISGVWAERQPNFSQSFFCEQYAQELQGCGTEGMYMKIQFGDLPPSAMITYQQVEQKTGVPWFYLAAWEKVATDFGRATNLNVDSTVIVAVPAQALGAANAHLAEDATMGDGDAADPSASPGTSPSTPSFDRNAQARITSLRSATLRGGSFGLFLTSWDEYQKHGTRCGATDDQACDPWDRYDAALMAAYSLTDAYTTQLAANGGHFVYQSSPSATSPEAMQQWLLSEWDIVKTGHDTGIYSNGMSFAQGEAEYTCFINLWQQSDGPCAAPAPGSADESTTPWPFGPNSGLPIIAAERYFACVNFGEPLGTSPTTCDQFAGGSSSIDTDAPDLKSEIELFYDVHTSPALQVKDWTSLEVVMGALLQDKTVWGGDASAFFTVPERNDNGPTGAKVSLNAYAVAIVSYAHSLFENWVAGQNTLLNDPYGALNAAASYALRFWRPAIDQIVIELAGEPHSAAMPWQYLATTLEADDAFGCKVTNSGTAVSVPLGSDRHPNTQGLLSLDPVIRTQQLANFDRVAAIRERVHFQFTNAIDRTTITYNQWMVPIPILPTDGPGSSQSPGGYITRDYPAGFSLTESIRRNALERGVDPLLVAAVIWKESSFRPAAGSFAGAIGLMQVMPAHARAAGIAPEQLYDPDTNIYFGSRILYSYIRRQPTLEEGLGSYLAGVNGVRRNGLVPGTAAYGYAMRVRDRYFAYLDLAGATDNPMTMYGDAVEGCWRFGPGTLGIWDDNADSDRVSAGDDGDGESPAPSPGPGSSPPPGGASNNGYGEPFSRPFSDGDQAEYGISISQRFGCSSSATDPPGNGCAHLHSSIDYSAQASGAPVRATARGRVTAAGADARGGYITILHPSNYTSTYRWLDPEALNVAAGDRVVMGQRIGKFGSRGLSYVFSATGYGVSIAVDPAPFFAKGWFGQPHGDQNASPDTPAARMNFCTSEFRNRNGGNNNCGTAHITYNGQTFDIPIVALCDCNLGAPDEELIELNPPALAVLGFSDVDAFTPIDVNVQLVPPAGVAVGWPRAVQAANPVDAVRALAEELVPNSYSGLRPRMAELGNNWISHAQADHNPRITPDASGATLDLSEPDDATATVVLTIPASDYMRQVTQLITAYWAASNYYSNQPVSLGANGEWQCAPLAGYVPSIISSSQGTITVGKVEIHGTLTELSLVREILERCNIPLDTFLANTTKVSFVPASSMPLLPSGSPAWGYTSSGRIHINDALRPAQTQYVAIHELGHVVDGDWVGPNHMREQIETLMPKPLAESWTSGPYQQRESEGFADSFARAFSDVEFSFEHWYSHAIPDHLLGQLVQILIANTGLSPSPSATPSASSEPSAPPRRSPQAELFDSDRPRVAALIGPSWPVTQVPRA